LVLHETFPEEIEAVINRLLESNKQKIWKITL